MKKIIVLIAVILIVSLLGVCLVACSAKTYKSRLEINGYTVSDYDIDKDVSWAITATKGGNRVTIVKYKNIDDAKQAEQETVDQVYREGKIVMTGTAQGIQDARIKVVVI